MKPLTQEWVNKAEADFSSAQRELRARKNPNYDAACFHAQQCVEKYIKASRCGIMHISPPIKNAFALCY